MKLILNNRDFLEFRDGMNNTVEILDIAVYSGRSKGTGSKMIRSLERMKKGNIYAFVRSSNTLAHNFYKKNGFKGTLLKNFYPDEDAYIFIK